MIAVLAAIVWGWIVVLTAWLASVAFVDGFREGWSALTRSPVAFVFFFCLPVLAFAASVVFAVRMSRGDLRDRPLALVLLIAGVPWALLQGFAMLLGL